MLTWDVDERRRSLYTHVYVAGMWLRRDKKAFEGEDHTVDKARKLQRKGNAGPTRLTRVRAGVTRLQEAGMTAWVVRPRRGTPRLRVVYVHGGGYVHPLTRDYWRLIRALVQAPAEVVVPAYPLAPDATVDDVVPKLLEFARRAGDCRLPTVLMGDSAGGAIVLVMARELCDSDGPRPVGVVALSPWLDARLEEGGVGRLEPSDPMLAESGLRTAGRLWAGRRHPADTRVSPVHIELDGLPPIDIFTGDKDILRPGVEILAERGRTADVQMHVHERPSMFHVWMTRAIPEARRTRHHLVRLVRERIREE